MNNQTKCGEQSPQASTIFSAFGTPEKIIMDGENITDEIVNHFGDVDKWLLRLAAIFNDFRVKAFTISRIGGVVKLHVRSVY